MNKVTVLMARVTQLLVTQARARQKLEASLARDNERLIMLRKQQMRQEKDSENRTERTMIQSEVINQPVIHVSQSITAAWLGSVILILP